jgi:hypothetical protein
MIRRALSMFAGGLMAVGASQAPEFAQQYAQRLGGAVDELRTVVRDFDADAARSGLSREDGLLRLETSPDRFTADRGVSQRRVIRRFETLEAQKQAMSAPDVVSRVAAMVRNYDNAIGREAMKDYRPAAPLTLEGLFFALVGFVAGIVVFAILLLPFGRRRRRPAEPAMRRSAP